MSLHPNSILRQTWATESSDVTFIVKEETFNMHTSMLCQNTQFYDNRGDMEDRVMVLDFLEPEAFHIVVEHMYTQVDKVIDVHRALDVYKVCVILSYDKFRNKCAEILRQTLDDDKAIELFNFNRDTETIMTHDFAIGHVMYNFNNISKLEKTLTLPYEQIKELLVHKNLNISDEIMAMQLVSKWFKRDPYSDEESLVGLISCLKFEEIGIEAAANEIYASENLNVYRRSDYIMNALQTAWDKCMVLNCCLKDGILVTVPNELKVKRCRVCPDQVILTYQLIVCDVSHITYHMSPSMIIYIELVLLLT